MASADPLPPIAPPTHPFPRPRLRGRLHQGAFVVSLGTGLSLVLAAKGATATAASLVYALSVTLLFGTSALYHRRSWSVRARPWVQRIDHSMIFVLIAGTYTPLAMLVLPRVTGIVVLCVVWGGALVAGGFRLVWRSSPQWLVYPMAVMLGLVSIVVLPDLLRHGGVLSLTLLVVGGAVYLAGTAILIVRRPDPRPSVFGYHEVFHLFTLVAGVLFFLVNAMAVANA